jgi:hypothetical protein
MIEVDLFTDEQVSFAMASARLPKRRRRGMCRPQVERGARRSGDVAAVDVGA